jgi:hypothetical protein
VGVESRVSLAKGGVRRSLVEVLLAMTAGRELYDMNGLETEVANVEIGRVVEFRMSDFGCTER